VYLSSCAVPCRCAREPNITLHSNAPDSLTDACTDTSARGRNSHTSTTSLLATRGYVCTRGPLLGVDTTDIPTVANLAVCPLCMHRHVCLSINATAQGARRIKPSLEGPQVGCLTPASTRFYSVHARAHGQPMRLLDPARRLHKLLGHSRAELLRVRRARNQGLLDAAHIGAVLLYASPGHLPTVSRALLQTSNPAYPTLAPPCAQRVAPAVASAASSTSSSAKCQPDGCTCATERRRRPAKCWPLQHLCIHHMHTPFLACACSLSYHLMACMPERLSV